MNKSTEDKLQSIRGKSVKSLTSNEIGFAKSYARELFEPFLPYKASNGICFGYGSKVIFSTSYGLIHGDNSFMGKDDYGFILRHSETAGDGSTSYGTSTYIDRIDTDALEKVALDIQEKMVNRAIAVIARFED